MADGGSSAMPGRAPSAAYEAGVVAGRWQDDPRQRALLPLFDRIQAAARAPARPAGGLLAKLRRSRTPVQPQGLYLWGGVGRGKTFLLDLLAASLPSGRAQRLHFHRFMAQVHEQLTGLRARGQADPLDDIAAQLARRCRVLCLDEFIVNDIGDAMLLSGLLEGLFSRGVMLATTSNTAPDNLYRNGLQRARFLPAIGLLKRHCQVVELVSDTDYRLRGLTRAPVYLHPVNADTEARQAQRFVDLGREEGRMPATLDIAGRTLVARGLAEDVAWFDFAQLCAGPRAVSDYIELARGYSTVLVSGVPAFGPATLDDQAKRFILLVDEFYDRKVKLLLTAEVPVTSLYPAGRLRAEFERTESRLIEMQSQDYLAQAHQP
ncbi:cell division protein ZapE [Pseudofulvimonas gallinarii]|nr:cell division protein ZapE [Pseudofulvimonas gallinarii]